MQLVYVVVSLNRANFVHREVARLPNYRLALEFLVRHQGAGRHNLDMVCGGRFVDWDPSSRTDIDPPLLGFAEWEPRTPQPAALVAA